MTQTSFLPPPPPVPPAESDEFYTPRDHYTGWDREFHFTVDACATPESTKVPAHFYTKAQDGLAQDYRGERVWCNPPYSEIEPWVVLAELQVRRGCPLWVALLPATKTEQPWWQRHVERYRDLPADRERGPGGMIIVRSMERAWTVTARFLPKRIAFGYPGCPDGGKGSGWFGNVLVIWRGAP